MRSKLLLSAAIGLLAVPAVFGQGTGWYTPTNENKPFVRWWWLGSAVDKEGLTYNLEEFAKAGIGGYEVTPIYGVQGNEANDIDYLSPKWMEMYKWLVSESARLGLECDLNNGTGWPFGGPQITPELAAQKMEVTPEGVKSVQTRQMVKRAAPGGEGFVMDHYNPEALKVYLDRFDKAFAQSGAISRIQGLPRQHLLGPPRGQGPAHPLQRDRRPLREGLQPGRGPDAPFPVLPDPARGRHLPAAGHPGHQEFQAHPPAGPAQPARQHPHQVRRRRSPDESLVRFPITVSTI